MRHPAYDIPFDTLYQQLQQAMTEGLIKEIGRDELRLYCYTHECVYSSAWSDITKMARGLILDIEAKAVVATPFIKFFNLHEVEQSLPDLPFDVFEKLDGSLIILFFHRGEWKAATKGHLRSPQAIWAMEWVKSHDLSHLSAGTTYLCEAIYPENRIVIEYEKTGLSLLAAYGPDGDEVDYAVIDDLSVKLGWDIAKRLRFESMADLITTARGLPATEEGFILRYTNGYRIKVKGEEYCRIHRLISNCTPLAVWEYMLAGQNLDTLRRDLPEEFWPDFDSILAQLNNRKQTLENRIRTLAESLQELSDKDIGLRLETLPEDLRKYMFSYRKSGGNFAQPKLRESIFRAIRPAGNALEGYTPSESMYRVQSETG